MLLGHTKMKRRSAGFAAMTGMICLVLAVGAPALALDPGDGRGRERHQQQAGNQASCGHGILPAGSGGRPDTWPGRQPST